MDVHDYFEGASRERERLAKACGVLDFDEFIYALEALAVAMHQHYYAPKRLLCAAIATETCTGDAAILSECAIALGATLLRVDYVDDNEVHIVAKWPERKAQYDASKADNDG